MIRHCVMMRWSPDATDEQRRAARDAVATLPSRCPSIVRYSLGDDAGLVEGNFDFVVVGDFDDVDGYRDYAAHPDHVAVIERYLKPIIAERAAVQYELES